jgi:hypothetical protein
VKFKRARFLDKIIAVGGKKGKFDKIIVKNLAEDEHSHMTLKFLPNGNVDFHVKNELTNTYESINWQLVAKFLSIAGRDVGQFLGQFNPVEGRFAKLPAILIKAPLFKATLAKDELLMTVNTEWIILGNVYMIHGSDFVIGFVDDWKTGEQYIISHKDDHYYRFPIMAFARHVLTCLEESTIFTDKERALMKVDDIAEFKISTRIVRNMRRIFYFVQPLYYRIMCR